jgi:hypothetical protein
MTEALANRLAAPEAESLRRVRYKKISPYKTFFFISLKWKPAECWSLFFFSPATLGRIKVRRVALLEAAPSLNIHSKREPASREKL